MGRSTAVPAVDEVTTCATPSTSKIVWHRHDNTDDFFLLLSGRIVIRLRDGEIELQPGELFVVPAGVEHQPCAPVESTLLLIEPTGTPNTGDPTTETNNCRRLRQ
jgi:mannose-6-phosphate isomerase-like protein (cupin superfamily)